MIGSFSSSSAYSSSSSASTSALSAFSAGIAYYKESDRYLVDRLHEPTETNLSDPRIRKLVKKIFSHIDGDGIGDQSARALFLAEVSEYGTEKQLNTIFAEMREAGQPAFFPVKTPSGVDFTIVSRDGTRLTWVTHTHTDYNLNDSGKFVLDSSEKENKYSQS